MPDWSPVRAFGGYQKRADNGEERKYAVATANCSCAKSCGVHGHAHANAWRENVPASDHRTFWAALGCSCWAF
jgi:hypothetical protein